MLYNKNIISLAIATAVAIPFTVQADRFEHHTATRITHGVATGDVRSDSAVIWSRSDAAGTMHVVVKAKGRGRPVYQRTIVSANDDFTGQVQIDGLRPDTEYEYRVWFGDSKYKRGHRGETAEGQFHTAPAASTVAPVSFAWGGDLAGQNTCRDSVEGFPIFNAINNMKLDFFIGLGDMIYADGLCEATGRYGNSQVPGDFVQAYDMNNYWAHWKYNREDDGYRSLLASMPYYAIWDDHEVVNDFGPLHDTRDSAPYTAGDHLLPKGLAAFKDYNPIAENAETPDRLYRTIRWGKNMEMFILDTRQYRDANLADDSSERPKTMLGREQLNWLKHKLAASDSTWKVIVSSVPMSIPTGGNGRDGWGNYDQTTGFENELTDILRFMQQNEMNNVIFITTDVHFAEAFRYTPFADAPEFQVHEIVTGPINAGVFPNRAYDDTLNTESLFFFGADSASDVTTWEQAKSWFNYGAIEIDGYGKLNASIRDINGDIVYNIELDPR